MTHEEYMAEALKLAENGRGRVAPNPMVGALLVKNREIIGSGWHHRCGEAHAERNALNSCRESPEGAALYVTLEPCCHYGRTPPCTKAILEAGVSRVIIGSRDPNPLVDGGGVEILRRNGVEVIQDVLKEECDGLNYIFFHYITHKTPYVLMKYAMTLDGKAATLTGASKWITGTEAHENVHRSRHEYSGIMAGIGTVLADDPLLTCRAQGGGKGGGGGSEKNPLRIICDSRLRIPLESQIVKTSRDIDTVIATASQNVNKIMELERAGCRVLHIPDSRGKVNLKGLMKKLHSEKLDSIYLEGGATLNYGMLSQGLVNRIHAYISPKVFGGSGALSPIGGDGVALPDEAILLKRPSVSFFGEDILLDCELR